MAEQSDRPLNPLAAVSPAVRRTARRLGPSGPGQTKTWRAIAAGASVTAYVVWFMLLARSGSRGVGALSVIPVALFGWLYGLRVGIVAGLLALPVNTALIDFNYGEGWDAVVRDGGAAGSVAIVIIGAIVGYLAEVLERLRRQSSALVIASREREERARLEGVLLAANTMQHHLCNQLTLTRGYTWLLANSEELTDINAEMAREAERGVIEASETLDRLLRLTSLVEDTSNSDLPAIIDLGRVDGG